MAAFKFPLIIVVSAAIIGVCLTLAWRLRRRNPHEQAVVRLLDAADALESRLRAAREQLQDSTGIEDESTRAALQQMLRQRLWLQQHGANASVEQLDEIRNSFQQAQARIDQQLAMIQRVKSFS